MYKAKADINACVTSFVGNGVSGLWRTLILLSRTLLSHQRYLPSKVHMLYLGILSLPIDLAESPWRCICCFLKLLLLQTLWVLFCTILFVPIEIHLLIPVRTDTKYFHEYIYPYCTLKFIKGRLKFRDLTGSSDKPTSAPFPNMICIYRNSPITSSIIQP